jgi:AcrR family transcriptional regulator
VTHGTAAADEVPVPPAKHRILEATYACIARSGLARTTVEDAAREAGVSRATVYRHFPGGRDELVRETVGHEVGHFFLELAAVVEGAATFADVLEEALVHAHTAVADHVVLQKLLANEPDRLIPNLSLEANRLLPPIATFLTPHLSAAGLREGVSLEPAAEYVARMVLSLVGAPGRWDLTDRAEVAELVRSEILAGVVAVDEDGALGCDGGDTTAG